MKKSFETIYSIIIVLFTIYVLLDTFVIEKRYQLVVEEPHLIEYISNDNSELYKSNIQNNEKSSPNTKEEQKTVETVSNASYYSDANITISVTGYYEYNSSIYVAEVEIKNPLLLKTAFAKSSYGRNITEKTSTMASRVNAILAVNGDYYGIQEKGFVLRNGTIYRNTSVRNQEDLVIYKDGSFEIINESETSLESVLAKGAYNLLSFGPTLVNDSKVSSHLNEDRGVATNNNPRTAIGVLANGHYVFVVSDGRTSKSAGLTLVKLAEFMARIGCRIAYNLDGGGSSTMYFNGRVINNPTNFGDRIIERSISDIVYVGY